MSLSSFLLVSSDEGQWVLELGCCTANAGPDLDYLRGGALPPSRGLSHEMNRIGVAVYCTANAE